MREPYIPPRTEVIDVTPEGVVLNGSGAGGSNEGWGYENL